MSFDIEDKNYIQEGDELSVQITQNAPSASDQNDGLIKVSIEGGTAPYKIVVHTNTRTTPLEYTGQQIELKGLHKGFYSFNITDAKGNFVSKAINL